MGLDMFAYVGIKENQDTAAAGLNESTRELAYWRKHPNLHGWMHKLWESKGNTGDFNGDELELTWEDLEQLEQDIANSQLPGTTGFFFGNPADDYYKQQDLEFIRNARAEIFIGLRVFYNSSW